MSILIELSNQLIQFHHLATRKALYFVSLHFLLRIIMDMEKMVNPLANVIVSLAVNASYSTSVQKSIFFISKNNVLKTLLC